MPQVRERMTKKVVTIQPGTTVVDAAKTMIREEKGPLPIVEGDRPIAIVTDRDLVAPVIAEGNDPSSTKVDDVASKDLVTIEPDKDVDDALELMSHRELNRMLVTLDGGSVGVISVADIRRDEGLLA